MNRKTLASEACARAAHYVETHSRAVLGERERADLTAAILAILAGRRPAAAAPDLLAALIQVRESLANWIEIQSPEEARDYDARAMAAADAAIARARGTE